MNLTDMLYIFAALAAASVFLWYAFYRFTAMPVQTRTVTSFSKFKIEGELSGPENIELPEGDLYFGFSDKSSVNLGKYTYPPSGNVKKSTDGFVLSESDKGLFAGSESSIRINGVRTGYGKIIEQNIIRCGSCKIVYLGKEERTTVNKISRSRQDICRLVPIPGFFTFLTLLLLIIIIGKTGVISQTAEHAFSIVSKIKEMSFSDKLEPELEPATGTVAKPLSKPVTEEAAAPAVIVTEKIPPDNTVSGGEKIDAAFRPVIKKPEPAATHSIPRPLPVMIPPGGSLPEDNVDVLFIHAHPDDESIDFGTLIAISSNAGLKSGVLLLTDGESGIFQQNYAGDRNRIAEIRVNEALYAIGILGSSYYIRFGFKNHPYNTLFDKKTPDEVLDAWGGKDYAAQQIAEALKLLRPSIVVTPDKPSGAREHFEHEAAGIASLQALEILRTEGGFIPKAHIVCVDPAQRSFYSSLLTFFRKDVFDIQKKALLVHKTQADASVLGVKMISKYDQEYYSVKYWELEKLPEQFFNRSE